MNLPISLKPGVDIRGIKPECVFGALITASVYERLGVPFLITSVLDGKHGKVPRGQPGASLHYQGLAFDCRLPSRYTGNGNTDTKIHADLIVALGPQYDAVLEEDHIHVEFDPD